MAKESGTPSRDKEVPTVKEKTAEQVVAEQAREAGKVGSISISAWGDVAGSKRTRSASFGTGGPGGVSAAIFNAREELSRWLVEYDTEVRRAEADTARETSRPK